MLEFAIGAVVGGALALILARRGDDEGADPGGAIIASIESEPERWSQWGEYWIVRDDGVLVSENGVSDPKLSIGLRRLLQLRRAYRGWWEWKISQKA